MEFKTLSDFKGALDAPLRVVLAAFGPNGGQVMIAGGEERVGFDDGYRAIQRFVSDDPLTREATAYLCDAARAQHETVGDGTSTAMLLTDGFIRMGEVLRKKKVMSTPDLLRAIDALVDQSIENLDNMADRDVTEAILQRIARLSMHGDSAMGNIVGSLVWQLGRHGAITASSKAGGNLETIMEEGFVWTGGVYDESMFTSGSRFECDEALVMMVNGPQENIESALWERALSAYRAICSTSGKNYGLILVCPSAAGSVTSSFSRSPGKCVIRTPRNIPSHLFLEDLSSVIGGIVVDNARGSMDDRFSGAHFGRVSGLFATKHFSCIRMTEEQEESAVEAMEALKQYYSDVSLKDDPSAKSIEKSRMACLAGRVGEIRVPFFAESQFSAIREVVEDGIGAAKAAFDGWLPGGGYGLKKAADDLDIPIQELEIPLEVVKCFRDVLGIPHSIIDPGNSGGVFSDQFFYPIDPLNVLKNAVRNAWSVARPIVNTNIILL